MFEAVVNRKACTFDQIIVNRILFQVAQGKKIIVLGVNWQSAVFCKRYNIPVAYYAVCNYSKEVTYHIDDKSPIKSIYDIAFESPGTFFVISAELDIPVSVVYNLLMDLGLKVFEDYCALLTSNVENWNFIIDDPHLHTSTQYELPGVKVFGNMHCKNAVRIIALGGSTTDPSLCCTHAASWPQHLFDILQRKNIPALVFNCGTAAFASSREFIKFCRDGLELKPDLVISYSGVNDLTANRPFFTNRFNRPWIEHETEILSRGAGNHLNGKITYGLQTDKTQAESWVQHMQMLHAVCDEFGIKFFAFFQGFVGSKSSPTYYEKCLAESNCNTASCESSAYYRARAEIYSNLKNVANYADEISKLIQPFSYIYNYRNLYDGVEELLIDLCHTLDTGNHLIAIKICQALEKEQCFPLPINRS